MAQSNLQAMNKFPSVSSIHSMVSMGYLPPGHGYIPKKIKPDKPYGPSFITILNRTWRGPGRRWVKYSIIAICLAVFFYIAAALYFAHRNVQRLIVKHTEPLGACLLMLAICLTAATFRFIYQARMESNKWRGYIRFEPDGLFHIQPTNEEYSPKDNMKLSTGTYGPRAVKEIPKPRFMKKSRPASRAAGRKMGPTLSPLTEGDENVTIEEDELDLVLPPPGFLEKSGGKLPLAEETGRSFDLSNMPTTQIRGPSLSDTRDTSMYGRPTPGLERIPANSMERLPTGRYTPGLERMPPSMDRMPPQASFDRAPPGVERMPGRYQPEPRMAPGSANQSAARLDRTPPTRMAPGSNISYNPVPPPSQNPYSPEPRMAPGSQTRMAPSSASSQPPARMVPGSQPPPARMVPGSASQPPARMVPGSASQPPARMVPGSSGRTTPAPRMAPGSQPRPAPGSLR